MSRARSPTRAISWCLPKRWPPSRAKVRRFASVRLSRVIVDFVAVGRAEQACRGKGIAFLAMSQLGKQAPGGQLVVGLVERIARWKKVSDRSRRTRSCRASAKPDAPSSRNRDSAITARGAQAEIADSRPCSPPPRKLSIPSLRCPATPSDSAAIGVAQFGPRRAAPTVAAAALDEGLSSARAGRFAADRDRRRRSLPSPTAPTAARGRTSIRLARSALSSSKRGSLPAAGSLARMPSMNSRV